MATGCETILPGLSADTLYPFLGNAADYVIAAMRALRTASAI